MAHKPRSEMIAETRAKLVAAARDAFGRVGYANASMDDFTAGAGLTRGALYHHFGGKQGLLEAVITQIDAEMTARLNGVSARFSDPWQGFVEECVGYIEMALEPEIQRIMLLDGPAVLGNPFNWPNQPGCIRSLTNSLKRLVADGQADVADPEATARLVSGASLHASLWIANSDDPEATSKRAVAAFKRLLEGLRTGAPSSG
ncbi:TetR/AcrR family transcriptional regulator [Nitratireductor rhodophyticola]|uniref:TetR/AcrR family transcriptional regulator n=1 Tax=Nitratireductor rhodophyticola TaxID=2854036 RepID=UPI0008141220|nr:TetR/AcrR family transcriptional regulator [Nitratireductor rhodophyticola]MEC9247085.1 TetR/AcrR family transcriptional regulator [Pseudomonadota bacterium]WPZ14255.1 TetR/AcrR family transcriptional regulator [Nitratireductor rhodophyticola]